MKAIFLLILSSVMFVGVGEAQEVQSNCKKTNFFRDYVYAETEDDSEPIRCNLIDLRLSNEDLSYANFSYADLSYAHFTDTDVSYANFRYCNMSKVKFLPDFDTTQCNK